MNFIPMAKLEPEIANLLRTGTWMQKKHASSGILEKKIIKMFV